MEGVNLVDLEAKSTKKKVPEKISSIERSMGKGVSDLIDFVIDESTVFSHNEISAITMFHDCPIFGPYVDVYEKKKRHQKGWITKILIKIWNPFVKAFQSIYYNKKVKRALEKANANQNRGDNW